MVLSKRRNTAAQGACLPVQEVVSTNRSAIARRVRLAVGRLVFEPLLLLPQKTTDFLGELKQLFEATEKGDRTS
jgi:hypothetical protein